MPRPALAALLLIGLSAVGCGIAGSDSIDAPVTVFTGSNTRDRAGNIYMAAFEWDHACLLAILRPR